MESKTFDNRFQTQKSEFFSGAFANDTNTVMNLGATGGTSFEKLVSATKPLIRHTSMIHEGSKSRCKGGGATQILRPNFNLIFDTSNMGLLDSHGYAPSQEQE